jgi:signal transduction histidine kinase
MLLSCPETRLSHTSLIPYRALLERQQLVYQHQQERLGRRIHDEICQELTLLSLQLSLATCQQPENWAQQCQQWSSMVLKLGRNLRNIINELQPQVLDEFGLIEAIQWLAHSCPEGVQCHLRLPQTIEPMPPVTGNEVFAICRDIVNEAFVANDVKKMTIAMEQTSDLLQLHLRTDQENPELASLASRTLEDLAAQERLFCLEGSVRIHHDSATELAITICVPIARQSVPNAA